MRLNVSTFDKRTRLIFLEGWLGAGGKIKKNEDIESLWARLMQKEKGVYLNGAPLLNFRKLGALYYAQTKSRKVRAEAKAKSVGLKLIDHPVHIS